MDDIDWVILREAATDAMYGAYAPYSNFPVGAAGLVDDGRIVRGCNVENASYGMTLCAECGVISALHVSGGGRLIALSCVDLTGTSLMPCGRCRQLLWEHGGPEMLVATGGDPVPMAELLPIAFDIAAMDSIGARAGVRVETRAGGREQPGSHLRDMLGRGTVFVHPDAIDGQRAWTGYWDASAGAAGDRAAILDEAPTMASVADAIEWGLARTRRVIVVDADGGMFWAGEGPAPAEVSRKWDSR